jgi:hypothetical protein
MLKFISTRFTLHASVKMSSFEQDVLDTIGSLNVTFWHTKHVASEYDGEESDRAHVRELAALHGDWIHQVIQSDSCDRLKVVHGLVMKDNRYLSTLIFKTIFEMLWAQDNRGEPVCMDQVVFLRSLGLTTHPFHWETIAGVSAKFIGSMATVASVATAPPSAQRLLEPLTFAEFIAMENKRDALYEKVSFTALDAQLNDVAYLGHVRRRAELIEQISALSIELHDVSAQVERFEETHRETLKAQLGEAAALGKKVTELRKRVIG